MHEHVPGTIGQDLAPLNRHELEAWWQDWLGFGEMYGMTLLEVELPRTLRPVTPRVVATGRLAPLGRALLPHAEKRLTSRVRRPRRDGAPARPA